MVESTGGGWHVGEGEDTEDVGAVVQEGSMERFQGFSMAVWTMEVGNVKEEY